MLEEEKQQSSPERKSLDDREGIIDFMRDSAGHLPKFRKPCILHEFFAMLQNFSLS
jgi:hypothetical protein